MTAGRTFVAFGFYLYPTVADIVFNLTGIQIAII